MILNLGVVMDLDGLYGMKRVVRIRHCYFAAGGGILHECKATCQYDFKGKIASDLVVSEVLV